MCRQHVSKLHYGNIYSMLTVQVMTRGHTNWLSERRACWQQKPEAFGPWVLNCKLGQFFSVALQLSSLSLSTSVVLIVPVKPDHVQPMCTYKVP